MLPRGLYLEPLPFWWSVDLVDIRCSATKILISQHWHGKYRPSLASVIDDSLPDTGLLKYLKVNLVALDPISQGWGKGGEFPERLWWVFLSTRFLEELNFRNWLHVQECSEWYGLHLVTVFSLYDITVTVTGYTHTHIYIHTHTRYNFTDPDNTSFQLRKNEDSFGHPGMKST